MKPTTRKITHSALMVALAMILSMFKIINMPNGGAITFASMAPIIIIALMYDVKWALLTSLAFALLQMLEFYPPPTQSFWSFTAVVLLDYVIAFGVLGLAGVIARRFSNRLTGATVATLTVIAARFTCSFISGVLIWSSYAPEGMPVWIYSLTYNGSVMLGEMVTTALAVGAIVKFVDLRKMAHQSAAA